MATKPVSSFHHPFQKKRTTVERLSPSVFRPLQKKNTGLFLKYLRRELAGTAKFGI